MIMKTKYIFLFAAAFIAASCAKEIVPNEENPTVEPVLVPMEFTASVDTKAFLLEDGRTVNWNDNESICLFDNLGGDQQFAAATGGASAYFSGNVTEGSTEFYALYPYRAAAEFDAATKTVTSKLFPDQAAAVGSYAMGDGGAVMVAKADGNTLSFKNMTSHIKFTLAEDMTDVVSITLIGNKSEALCGLYTVDFSGETPVVKVTKPETYVTLRNKGEGITPLAPGDYYFTVFPVEFTEGFTVILSKKDGSQVAKKTSNSITSLNKRNQILPMKPLASTDYSEHMNYFIKYNDKFDVTIGGYTFNKTTHPGAILVNDTKENCNIGKDGVYFVSSDATKTAIDYNACTKLMIIGADAAVRVPFAYGKILQPQNSADGYIIMSSLDITTDKARLLEQNKQTLNSFNAIVFSNCKISSVGAALVRFTNMPVSLDRFVLEECDYMISGTSANSHVYNTNAQSGSINNFIVRNNVFHSLVTGTLNDFKIVNGLNSTGIAIKDMTIEQNTLVGALAKGTGYVNVAELTGNSIIRDNFYVGSHNAATSTPIINAVTFAETFICTIQNNFFFVEGATKGLQYGPETLKAMAKAETEAGIENSAKKYKVGNPRPLTFNPLSDTWNPSVGLFGYKAGLQYYDSIGDKEPKDDVPVSSGAQRQAPAAPSDTPAVNYVSINLGTI